MHNIVKVGLLALATTLTSPVMAQAPEFAHLAVVGHGEVKAKPDMAEFSVSVEIEAKTPKVAKNKADKVVADFLAKLAKQGVQPEQITSSNLLIQPHYDYAKDKPRQLTGYIATRQVTVTVTNLDKLSTLLDIALTEGFNRVSDVQLKSSKMDALEREARQQAIANAKMMASDIAQGFGQKVDGVWQVTYQKRAPMPVYAMAAEAKSLNNRSAGYQDSYITVTDRIEVIFRLAQ